jgi:IS30 family transposase
MQRLIAKKIAREWSPDQIRVGSEAKVFPWSVRRRFRVSSKHAEVVKDAIIALLKSEKAHLHTVTFDNGKEFAYHAKLKKALGADNYFAHPYCSWERGLNENHNGLIRQYLPKGMALDKVTAKEIRVIQNKLNNRPRKLLGYKTPNEIYDAMRLAA